MNWCVDCNNRCVNKCSNCGRPYCANCRNASGYTSCLTYCRTKKAAKKQVSQAAQQQSRSVQHQQGMPQATTTAAPSYTPPPHLAQYTNQPQGVVGATPPPPLPSLSPVSARLMLYAMDDTQFAIWQQRSLDALHEMMSRGRAYLDRRKSRGGEGQQTSTDIAMERDQVFYQDWVQAIEEIAILRQMANQQQPQQHSGQTGMLLMYDTWDDKLQK